MIIIPIIHPTAVIAPIVLIATGVGMESTDHAVLGAAIRRITAPRALITVAILILIRIPIMTMTDTTSSIIQRRRNVNGCRRISTRTISIIWATTPR